MDRVPKMEDILSFYKSILKFLSESSDDYFFLMDIQAGRMYFPERIKEGYALMENGADFCTLEEWWGITYPEDLPGLWEDIRLIKSGERVFHNAEYRIWNREGEIVWISCRGKVQQDESGQPRWMIGRVSDTLSRSKVDRLTGAFTKDVLNEDLEQILTSEQEGYLLLMDVDDQKSINLKNGQAHGDEILRRVAESLTEAVGGDQRIYRMNGDCFAVCLPGRDAEAVSQIFRRLQSQLEGKCTLSGGCVPFQTYKVPDGRTLCQYAENSVDYAKNHGKNMLRFFSAQDYEKDLAALELKEELQKCIQEGFQGFSLFYQPQVYSHSYRLHGAEALLRYRSPRRGDISPTELVPILEESGMICPVGIWVLETALWQCGLWRQTIPDFRISVNMSYVQLQEEDIVERVLDALRCSGMPGSALTIEVTESLELLDYTHLNDCFRRWKDFGIAISIDDFGTGYSSLGRLKEMEIDEIKIDRCFVSNIQHSAYNYRLLSNMVQLAESSGIQVCCEGVETIEELEVLEKLRPQLLQGYLFSKPCSARSLEERYLEADSEAFRERERQEKDFHRAAHHSDDLPDFDWQEEKLVQAIMEAENDIFYVSDLESYELYYLNPAGQRMLRARDYRGKKCYQVLQGRDSPCPFCTNEHLKSDSFYIWDQVNEHCKRHFLLKDKLLNYKGKRVRMEVALDITKHEIVSQNLQERLNFASKVMEYTRNLSGHTDCGGAVRYLLSCMGEYYQADRAYLFEPDARRPGHWNNTYEWCREHVTPQLHNLQRVPPVVLKRWMELFQENQAVRIYNLDALQKSHPEEWRVLKRQDIDRLVAVPVWINRQLIAFVGIDNPRYCIHDDAQLRVLSYFLVLWIRQGQCERRFQGLLCSEYSQILTALNMGLWVIRLDPESRQGEMMADGNMLRLMGLENTPGPEECYRHWHSRIKEGYYHYVDQAVERMIQTRRPVQLEYTWIHPVHGEVIVECTGIRLEDEDGKICLKGHHRIVSGMECVQSLPDVNVQDVFEYNEGKQTIFFHNERRLILGEACHEADFPRCWVEKEIVHPHFAAEFREAFSHISRKADLYLPEVLLKGKSGDYEWFRLTLRHLGRDQMDRDTVVVAVEPAGAERVRELEFARMRRFYQSLLSETIAYAELDLESGRLKAIGGLWKAYEGGNPDQQIHFVDALHQRMQEYVPAEEAARIRWLGDREGWGELLRQGNLTHRFCYRRPVGEELHWVELVVHIFRENITQNAYALLYLKDINAEREQALAQAEAASRDPLTGIYNRSAFEREVCAHVQHSAESDCGVLMLLDVDDFKNINDQMGHLVGDQALQEISQLLRSAFRQEDLIGRLGGDEFLVFVKGPMERATLVERLGRLLERLQRTAEYSLASSIGITFVNKENFDYTRKLGEADTALYYGKQMGKNQFFFFEDLPRL